MRLSRHHLATLLAAALCSTTHARVVGGDFNGDGRDDLAIGIPREDVREVHDGPGFVDAGAVAVLYGADSGLQASGNQFWSQNSQGVADQLEFGDNFGWALAAGDFDNDGFTDLAIGVPGERLGFATQFGAVNVLYGSPSGLQTVGHQFFDRDSPGVTGIAHAGDRFGDALAAADFNGDGFADLAVGVPNDIVSGQSDAGSVHIFYGSPGGLTANHDQMLHQSTAGIAEAPENSDHFGSVLAADDFNDDGFADLAIGVLDESISGNVQAGAVHVLYGSPAGLRANGSQLWSQNSPGILGAAEADDNFGKAIAAGDFDHDGVADLAIGVPGEDIGDVASAGQVHIIYGSSQGLTGAGDQVWHQASPGIDGAADETSTFGAALAAGDFNGDHFADLAVGIPRASPMSVERAGAVAVLFGSAVGIAASGHQRFDQTLDGMQDAAEEFDSLGGAVAAGDFDGDGFADLAVAISGEGIGGVVRAGAVAVLYGVAEGLQTADDQLWHQDQPGIRDECEIGDSLGAPPS